MQASYRSRQEFTFSENCQDGFIVRFQPLHGLPCVLRDSNRIGVQFLLTDLDLALTFLTVASTSRNLEITHRNWRNARKAHDAILHLLPRLTTTDGELQSIDEKLSALRFRLEAVGETF